ncbi:transcriptional regulator, partial [Xanthomonas citri pv. citri]|nr:transcriptional regulator [Xanthomonas citri pv. citri]
MSTTTAITAAGLETMNGPEECC